MDDPSYNESRGHQRNDHKLVCVVWFGVCEGLGVGGREGMAFFFLHCGTNKLYVITKHQNNQNSKQNLNPISQKSKS